MKFTRQSEVKGQRFSKAETVELQFSATLALRYPPLSRPGPQPVAV
jgi:hypothetical protein